jgi:hypothetical protein
MSFARIRRLNPWRNPDLFAIVPVWFKHNHPTEYDRIMASKSIGQCISRLKRFEDKYGDGLGGDSLPFPIVDPRVSKTRDVRTDLKTTSDYSYNRVDPTYFESRATVEGRGVKSIDNPHEPPASEPEPTPYVRPKQGPCATCGKDHVGHGFSATEYDKFVSAVGEFGCTI